MCVCVCVCGHAYVCSYQCVCVPACVRACWRACVSVREHLSDMMRVNNIECLLPDLNTIIWDLFITKAFNYSCAITHYKLDFNILTHS